MVSDTHTLDAIESVTHSSKIFLRWAVVILIFHGLLLTVGLILLSIIMAHTDILLFIIILLTQLIFTSIAIHAFVLMRREKEKFLPQIFKSVEPIRLARMIIWKDINRVLIILLLIWQLYIPFFLFTGNFEGRDILSFFNGNMVLLILILFSKYMMIMTLLGKMKIIWISTMVVLGIMALMRFNISGFRQTLEFLEFLVTSILFLILTAIYYYKALSLKAKN